MVRWIVLPLVLWASSAAAQSDWSTAGGALFVGAALDPMASPDEPGPRSTPLTLPNAPFEEAIKVAASRYGLDHKLLHALVAVESGFRPDAVSRAGAVGLTQLMPATAQELGVGDRFDPQDNLLGGADYLARQLVRFGDLRLALAAFNAGPARVEALGQVPAIAETQAYVDAVVECFLALSAGRNVTSSGDCHPKGVP